VNILCLCRTMLIPSLVGTGRRVITIDRRDIHYGPVAEALRETGHLFYYHNTKVIVNESSTIPSG